MTPPTVPPKLRTGDTLRVVAPAETLGTLSAGTRAIADERWAALGLRLTFGAHADDRDDFDSAPVAARVADLHEAFADPGVAGVVTVIGGFNSNQLLPSLDWDVFAANPKVLCGFSDITALQNALLARSGLVTYSGPHYSTFGMRHHLEDTLAGFQECLFDDAPFELRPGREWTDYAWFLDQEDRHPEPNAGPWVLAAGTAEGRLVGGNLGTFHLLHGTPFMPSLEGTVVVVEDDDESQPHHVDRTLTSLLQQPGWGGVRGLVIGRFPRASGMTRDLLAQIVATTAELVGLPIVANVDIGHTSPLRTWPVGGEIQLHATAEESRLAVIRH